MDRSLIRWASLVLVAAGSLPGQPAGPESRVATPARLVVSPPNPNARSVPLADLFYTHRSLDPAWSPDGSEIVFTTNVTGRYNLWKMDRRGGSLVQLLESDEAQSTPIWSPDGRWIVYIQDVGGNELYDLYAMPSGGGTPVNLTRTPNVSEDDPIFSPDGRWLAMDVKAADQSSANVAVLDWATHETHLVTHEGSPDYLWQVFAWSRDGKHVFANRIQESYTNADIYRIDVGTGELHNLTRHDGDVLYKGASISPMGDVLFSSTAKGGYQNVGWLDATTGRVHWITDTQWEASAGNVAPDGSRLTYTLNEDGQTTLYLYDRATHRSRRLRFSDGITQGVGSPNAFSPDGVHLLVYHEDGRRPSDLWLYDLATDTPHQLTHAALASVDPAALPTVQLVRFASAGGLMISAYLWVPPNIERDGSHPVVVLPHGGPTGQTVDDFRPLAVALASRGYLCISPNVRGSTGYGLAFQKANYKDLGGGDLEDEIAAARFVVATGYGDPKRVGITGESYGGYVTLYAIGKRPDVWAAAASEYGIIDWRSLIRHTDPRLRQYVESLLGDPIADSATYVRTSAITYLANATAPLLVLQGENDPRVPKEEAEQAVAMLTANHKTVAAHYYPAEGHGFEKREDQIDAIQRIVDWFDRYLKGSPAS